MSETKKNAGLAPDYLFEVSWEVCNKVGASTPSSPPKR